MWLVATYESASLFSLKASMATSSGGKTLLVPTPFAFKMALLDSACRTFGLRGAKNLWNPIRDAQVAIQPAKRVIVTNLFTRIWKPYEFKGKASEKADAIAEASKKGKYPFQSNIGYREYVQFVGKFSIAINLSSEVYSDRLARLFYGINYLGKRGSFVQLFAPIEEVSSLPSDFVNLTQNQAQFVLNGVMQVLDDCTSELTFEKADIYSGKRITGKERVFRNIVLPYRASRSSRSFTLYEYTG